MSAQTYGQIGDHIPSLLFLWFGYLGCLLWMKWTSRRPREEADTRPSGLPRGRRVGCSVHAPNAARFSGPTTEAERPSLFDWNA